MTGARFTTGSTFRHVTVMTLTGSVGLMFMFMVDIATLFWVGQLGDPQLIAAVGFAWVIQFFTISAGIGLAIATTALVSRSIGAGDQDGARETATGALVITFAVQATLALAVLLARDPILAVLGAEGETATIASRFLSISVPFLPIMAFAMAGGAILRAVGDALRSMLVTLGAGLIAIFLDPFLILHTDVVLGVQLPFTFGLGLGVDGAAWGVAVSRTAAGAMGLYFVIFTHRLTVRPSIAGVVKVFPAYVRVAGPAIATQLSTPFGNFILTALVAVHGDAAVAGWSVVSRVTVLAFGGIFALSGAIGGIIGQNYGAHLFERVRGTYRDALVFCTAYVAVLWAVLAASGPALAGAFGLEAEGREIVLAFTNIAAGLFVFTGAIFVANAAFNNLGRPIWSTGVNWLRDAVVILPMAWAMDRVFGAPGVVYGQALAGVVVGIGATIIGWRLVKRLSAAPVPA